MLFLAPEGQTFFTIIMKIFYFVLDTIALKLRGNESKHQAASNYQIQIDSPFFLLKF